MEYEEPSPVKLINRCLEIKPYNCLIFEKRAEKENLRSPREKGISAFVTGLGLRGGCSNFGKKSAYNGVFDFNNNTLKKNEVSIKWDLGYYSTFTDSKNVKTINQMRKSTSSFDTDGTTTRSQKPLTNLIDVCIFLGYIKHKNDKKVSSFTVRKCNP